MIILANGKTGEFPQRTDDAEKLWVRTMKVLKRANHLQKHTDKSFYDPTGLPGQDHRRFIAPEWLWTPAVRPVKQLLRR